MAATTTGLNLGGKLFFGGLCVGTFGLGCWQTQRFFEKETMIKQRKEDLELEPIPFSSTTGRSPDDRGLRRQLVHGVYQHDKEILVGPRGPPPGAMASTGPSSGRSGGGMSSSPQVSVCRYICVLKFVISSIGNAHECSRLNSGCAF